MLGIICGTKRLNPFFRLQEASEVLLLNPGFSLAAFSGYREIRGEDKSGLNYSQGHLWCRPFWQTKKWVIVFVFLITARSASALTVAFFRLLEPLSYVRFDILMLMQVSLL